MAVQELVHASRLWPLMMAGSIQVASSHSGVLDEGSFGAFVLDQLSELGNVEAKPMFGGAGFYLDGEFFGILYKQHLYFRVSPDTIGEYTKRKMKPFRPFEGKRGSSKNYYQVPVEIIESSSELITWARAAAKRGKR